jgi:AFG3 family protein
VCNDAAILAIRQNQTAVGKEDFELAILRSVVGHGNSAVKLSGHERLVVAYHEAGHAVAGWFSKHADQLIKVNLNMKLSKILH